MAEPPLLMPAELLLLAGAPSLLVAPPLVPMAEPEVEAEPDPAAEPDAAVFSFGCPEAWSRQWVAAETESAPDGEVLGDD